MYILAMILLIFFAGVGLISFVLSVMRLLTESSDKSEYFLILPKITSSSAEYKLRCAASRMRELSKGEILCLCDGCDTETQEICRRMTEECPYLSVLSKEELKEKLGLN